MEIQARTDIATTTDRVFRAMVDPDDLLAWWGCEAVVDGCEGGTPQQMQ